jgi:5-methylcytosine-specific restriction endonuclease McrA
VDTKTKRYLIGAIRKIWRWSKERRECLKTAQRSKKRYLCNICHKLTLEPVVDHVIPVVPLNWGGVFWDWDVYVARMFHENLQTLCKKCHNYKSNLERQERNK